MRQTPKVVLLDRDGTVIVDPPDERVDRLDKIKLFPDSLAALKYLAEHGFSAIFITNQAGIAEGRFNESEFETINAEVLKQLESSGITILKTYMSPHGSTEVNEWRKPGPGMLLQAAKDFGLDLSSIYMVGDRKSDIEAGRRAGTKTVLVKTANVEVVAPEATHTAQTLLDAAKYIASQYPDA